LDNLITDWVVRNGIVSSLNMVESSKRKIESLQKVLAYEFSRIENGLVEQNDKRKEIILRA